MKIGVLGISYKSAEIHTQECISKACRKKLTSDSDLAERYHCVILFTCNRTEIYFSADNLAEAHSALLHTLREEIDIPFEHKLYSYFGFDCFLHLAHVTAGLDSMIVAESEIQRQVKVSYEQTLLNYSLPSCMHYMFQKCLKIGKEIRSRLPLAQNQTSIAKILFQVSSHLFKDLSELPLLFIGNSEINRKVMAFFRRKGIGKMTLCTRSLHSAREMAEKEEMTLLSWENLSRWQEFPLVICGSNASQYIASIPDSIFSTRLIFDLGVPRNVDPRLARHPQLTLFDMQKLSVLIEQEQEKNQYEISRAETIVLKGVQGYLEAYRSKQRQQVYLCV